MMISDARRNPGMAILHSHVAELLVKIAKSNGAIEKRDLALASIYAASLDKRSRGSQGDMRKRERS